MRYAKPFTLVQRQTALAVYRSMRITYDNMRFHVPPSDAAQRRLVSDYRRVVMNFARALGSEDAKVDVAALNEAEQRSVRIAVDYTTLRLGSQGRSDE